MDELKVSVVVPVYNLEDYIEKCIQSILDQTYKNYELILVDDGSTDHSYDMCQKYSESYDNIFAYSQENGGPNAARLTGVENSTGEYILFVDGDDWIESNMLEELVKKQQESGAEIVTSGAYRGVGEQCTKKVDSLNEGIYEKEDLKEIYSRLLINHKFAEPGILHYLWGKLINKKLIIKALKVIPKSINYGEDVVALFVCIVNTKSVMITKQIFYHYVMRDNSAVNSFKYDFFEVLNKAYNCMRGVISKDKYVLKLQLDAWIIQQIYIGINEKIGIDKQLLLPNKQLIGMEQEIVPNMRIGLYGAGKIGQPIYTRLKSLNRYRIVLWVDNNYEKYQRMGLDVQPTEQLEKVDYDYLIIAVKGEDFANSIKRNLMEKYAIPEYKIKYYEPRYILDSYYDLDSIFNG